MIFDCHLHIFWKIPAEACADLCRWPNRRSLPKDGGSQVAYSNSPQKKMPNQSRHLQAMVLNIKLYLVHTLATPFDYLGTPLKWILNDFIGSPSPEEIRVHTDKWHFHTILHYTMLCYTMLYYSFYFTRKKTHATHVLNQSCQGSFLGGSSQLDATPS